jgi:ribosome-associated protein
MPELAGRPVPDDDLELRFSRSSGPGGSHANTSDTRVELLFDLRHSSALAPAERALALRRLAPRLDGDGRVRVVAQDSRSQRRNRELALARLDELLTAALRPPPPRRRATAPSAQARARRLAAKRRAGKTKRLRRPPPAEDG